MGPGNIAFELTYPKDGFIADGERYDWPPLHNGLAQRYATKHENGTLEVGIKVPGAGEIIFQTKIPKNAQRLSVNLRWSKAEGMRFSLNGALVETRPFSKA